MTDIGGPAAPPPPAFGGQQPPGAEPASGAGSAPPDQGWAGPRPRPKVPSVVASVGGLLAFVGVVVLLGNLPHSGSRFWGLLLSAAALALGALAAWRWQGRPAAAAGVALSALSVVPFLVFVFVDPKRPGRTFSTLAHAKNVITGVLVLSAVAWLVAYLRGPGRRFAFYLGAALASVWLVVLLQLGVKASNAKYNSLSRPATAAAVPAGVNVSDRTATTSPERPATTAPTGFDQFTDSTDSFGSDSSSSDSFSSDPFGSSSNSFDSDPFGSTDSFNSDPFPSSSGSFSFGGRRLNSTSPVGSPNTTGLLSLVIGAGYAVAGFRLDRRGQERIGTPFFAVAAAALPVGIVLLGTGTIHAKPAEVLAVVTGLAFLWAGARGGRRFSSWYGGYGVLAGVTLLVADVFRRHPVPAGLVLVVLGVATAVAADLLSDRLDETGSSGSDGSGRRLRPFPDPAGPGMSAPVPGAPGTGPWGSPWPAEPWPAAPAPSAPAQAPPAQAPPAPPAGPTFEAPPGSPPSAG